jgi:hypothetical protein
VRLAKPNTMLRREDFDAGVRMPRFAVALWWRQLDAQ